MKKVFTYGLIILSILVLVGCDRENSNSDKENNVDNNIENYVEVVVNINMPLSFDDLDNYFELSLTEELEKNKIGEIIGDGSPIDEFGPYATEIEIYINENKLKEFEDIISKYRFPKGSYLEINGKKQEEFGNLLGVRLMFDNLNDEEIQKIYDNLKENTKGRYVYSTLFKANYRYTAYFYGESLTTLKDELNKELLLQNVSENVSIMDMLDYIKSL